MPSTSNVFGLVNPHDHKVRDYGLFYAGGPAVLANDIAGEVVKLGTGDVAAAFKVGDRVFSQTSISDGGEAPFSADGAGLQQFCLFDARYTAKVAETGLTIERGGNHPWKRNRTLDRALSFYRSWVSSSMDI